MWGVEREIAFCIPSSSGGMRDEGRKGKKKKKEKTERKRKGQREG